MDIQPLTHTDQAGNVYQRSGKVLRQITALAGLSEQEVLARVSIAKLEDPDYIQEEALVYWIREHQRAGNSPLVNTLADALLRRSMRLILSRTKLLRPKYAQEAEHDVISELFSLISDLKTDRGDFLQVRYWVVLDRIATNVFRRYTQQKKRSADLLSMDAEDNDDDGIDEHVTRNVGALEIAAPDAMVEQQELIADALARLPQHHQEAFIMRAEGWQIESIDPDELTISKYFRKDPRTIRNWLKQADRTLTKWRNEERS